MASSLIEYLLEVRGIESNYTDAWGKATLIPAETKHKLLAAMGYQMDDETQLAKQADEEYRNVWLCPLNPVQVSRGEGSLQFALRLPIELVSDEYICQINTEQGQVIEHKLTPIDGQLVNIVHIDEVEFQEYLIEIPELLPLGYHELALIIDDEVLASMRVIIAPERCYQPDDLQQGKKVWGLSVQLYCLRSETNWGVGDFSDLAYLLEHAAAQGADFVGLNPIHALYPANPQACSPYGPSSRRWLNFIYIDVTTLEGYDSPILEEMLKTADFNQRLAAAREAEYVDYETVTALKLQALSAIFDQQYSRYLCKDSKQSKAFKAFVNEGGESLQTLAAYDALQEHLAAAGKPCWGWPVFPEAYADYHNPEVLKFVEANARRIQFFLWLQWQAALQLAKVNQLALELNMSLGLYQDLAVGVSEGSAEIWGNKSLYCTDASVGAPPDVLGPLGQNWGLPPMDPEKLYQQQYQGIIDLFDGNMGAAGALRIDHVMALLRLWWVVKGDTAQEGGYVYYPLDDLLGILALESHRHQTLVIGEDLGTVPDEIRLKLADNGVYSYRVFFFEQAQDGGFFSPTHYPVQSMSTLTTHDMPTLTGYWHCHDLELGKQLALYPTDDIVSGLYKNRHENKQKVLDTLHGHHAIGDDVHRQVEYVGMNKGLNFALQQHMATGSSALLSLQLEDWLEMHKPVNIPGTFKEYPNWQRKLSHNLEQIFSDSELQDLARGLSAARNVASQ